MSETDYSTDMMPVCIDVVAHADFKGNRRQHLVFAVPRYGGASGLSSVRFTLPQSAASTRLTDSIPRNSLTAGDGGARTNPVCLSVD